MCELGQILRKRNNILPKTNHLGWISVLASQITYIYFIIIYRGARRDRSVEKAAMRIIPRPTSDASAFKHPPTLESEPSQWKNARVPLKKGQILIRNVQVPPQMINIE